MMDVDKGIGQALADKSAVGAINRPLLLGWRILLICRIGARVADKSAVGAINRPLRLG